MDASFPNWIYAAIFLTAFAISAASFRYWVRLVPRWGLVDQPGHRKIHHQPIPLAGGLVVATGLVLPFLIGVMLVWIGGLDADVTALSRYGLEHRAGQLTTLFLGALGMLGLGLVDDRKALSPGIKFAIQTAVALLVAGGGTRITLFIDSPLVSYVLTVFWILTLVNAFNFTDNMNGLCTGLAAISALVFGIHSALPEHYLVASFGFLIAGALFGFLPFNYPRAQAFLGDSGSHLVGYLIAVLAILPHFYHDAATPRIAVIAPLLVLGMVLVDLVWVVSYRLRQGLPVYVGDTNHLSHQLVRRGRPTWQAVMILWICHALLAAASFLLV